MRKKILLLLRLDAISKYYFLPICFDFILLMDFGMKTK